jgi:hypothetical protein
MLKSLIPAIALTTTLFGLLSTSAQASQYVSGQTELYLPERTNGFGNYSTLVQGAQWAGNITITSQQGAMGHYYYKGTFKDSPVSEARMPEESRTACTGNIELVRSSNGRENAMNMAITWTVTGGKKCTTVGKTFKLNLAEAIPKAIANGDYTQRWSRWTVVSPDGSLNCRKQPNGAILRTYKTNDEIFLDGRLGDTIKRQGNDYWMATYPDGKLCYVRANSRYIRPISVPF